MLDEMQRDAMQRDEKHSDETHPDNASHDLDIELDDLTHSSALTQPEIGAPPTFLMLAPSAASAQATSEHKIDDSMPSMKMCLPIGWTFTGNLVAAGDITLACKIEGDITCLNPNNLITLTDTCISNGNVTGRDIILQGDHTGNVNASAGRVCIEASAKINGAVTYTQIKMNGGLHNISLNHTAAATANATIGA